MDTTTPTRRTGRRPNFPSEFKRQVVEATLQPGATVSLIAREHDVNANLVFRGRHQYQEGLFGPVNQSATLLPVRVVEAPTDLSQVVHPQLECHSEIVVELGKAKLHHWRARSTNGATHLAAVTAMIAPPAGTRIWIAAYGHAPWLRWVGGIGANST